MSSIADPGTRCPYSASFERSRTRHAISGRAVVRAAASFLARATLVLSLAAAAASGQVLAEDPPAEPSGLLRPGVPNEVLQQRIDKAVERGATWLRARQGRDGGYPLSIGPDARLEYDLGGTSLAGLALLAAGDRRGDVALDLAMSYCRRNGRRAGSQRSVYETALLLQFVARYYHEEGRERASSRATVGRVYRLPADAMKWVLELSHFLADSQRATGEWGYPAGDGDLSNTQYAVLGLRAAMECGVAVPQDLWMRVLARVLALQDAVGPPVPRQVMPPGDPTPRHAVDGADRARGWSYGINAGKGTDTMATGSMTAAGIATLLIADECLRCLPAFPGYPESKQSEVARAIQDGFAWLDANFAVDQNPWSLNPQGGTPRSGPSRLPGSTLGRSPRLIWHFYYLYGLERACRLGSRIMLGKHDWYLRGCEHLLQVQQKDGQWTEASPREDGDDLPDTVWAILFFRLTTRPVSLRQASVVTR